jgi:hypothetical protein
MNFKLAAHGMTMLVVALCQKWMHTCLSVTDHTAYPQNTRKYSSAPVSNGNTFHDLPRLCGTAENTERYI